MKNVVQLSIELSQYPVLIRMVVGETKTELAIGTAFFYEYEDYYYLITNGHNITGVNPETNKRLAMHAAFPTQLHVRPRVTVQNSNLSPEQQAELGDREIELATIHPSSMAKIDLYHDEENANPRWFIHPDFGYQVDVVAIPVMEKSKKPPHVHIWPINKCDLLDTEARVADDVYILGYPFGITDSLELPIWKRGSIASEPSVPYKGLPRLLVDSATRSGMSGSPVILMRSGIHNTVGGFNDNSLIGTVFGFVGIYSGRIGQVEAEAQLGIVWRKEVIDEILSAKIIGTTDFQNA